jgi:hypothetical protein
MTFFKRLTSSSVLLVVDVKDIIVNSHHIPAAASTISSSLMDSTQTLAAATQTLDQSAVNQGKLPQQSHTRILSPYKTYS